MCGRFAITLPNDAMAQLFDAQPANDLPDVPNYNVCPTNQVHTIVGGVSGRTLMSQRWGFVPHWYKTETDGPLLINARSETIAQKPAFAQACRTSRCIIPVTGFYEWTKAPDGTRRPWYITNTDDTPLAFAGVWQRWGADQVPTCAIVTCTANVRLSQIHTRQPVILEPKDWGLWLGEQGKGAARLMVPSSEVAQKFHRVSTTVNSNKAHGSELIQEITISDD